MRKYFIFAIILSILTLSCWILWLSNLEERNSILIIDRQAMYKDQFVIEPDHKICLSKPFIVILVTSYVGHVELRSAHRRTMSAELLSYMNVKRIFLLASIPDKEKFITQGAINNEGNTFGDILQGSFVEDYKNLTFKHLMGLKWASRLCDRASFILKVDDDTVFNLEGTIKLLSNLKNFDTESFLMGYILDKTVPRRNKENKWFVTWSEYPESMYPPYLSGWYYVTTPATSARLCDESVFHPPFWIDDIFVTGILSKALFIKLKPLPKDFWLEYYELLECCIRDMREKFINCEYIVGPNGGRNNLIVEFNESLQNCNVWKNCTARSVAKPLKNTCIAYKDRAIFSNGRAEVQFINI